MKSKYKPRAVKQSDAINAKTDELKAALDKAVLASQSYNNPGNSTVQVALERWLALHSIGVKPRSIEFNQDIVRFLKKHWPSVMQKTVNDVTDTECVEFATLISHYSSSRYNGCINALRNTVPAARILPRKSPPHPDAKIPSPEEFDRLLAALDTAYRGRAGLVIRLLAHTGLRINEARLLKWTEVRSDHIYACAETTKNGRPRTIPFINGTKEVLNAIRQFSKGEFVLTQACCKTALKYASALTGLPRYSHHTFRHYFATRCIVSGVDIPTVAKWLGHTDGGVVLLKTYCHLLDEHSLAMAERVKLGGNLANPETLVRLHAEPMARFNIPAPRYNTPTPFGAREASGNKIVEVAFPEFTKTGTEDAR